MILTTTVHLVNGHTFVHEEMYSDQEVRDAGLARMETGEEFAKLLVDQADGMKPSTLHVGPYWLNPDHVIALHFEVVA